MARFVTGNSFSTGDQVTADKLNNAVNNAKASTDSVDNSSIAVDGSGVLSVKTSTSASDGVTFSKFQQIPANTVLVRDANSLGSVSAKAVADTQILIGDGTGFTSAALSGDATMTNAGAVTVSSVASGATGTTASSGDNSTKLATTEYVDSIRPNIVTTNNTAASSVSATTHWTDFPSLEVTVTPRLASSKFIIDTHGLLGNYGSQMIQGKIQYKVNSGSYADVVVADSPSNRPTVHGILDMDYDNSEWGGNLVIHIGASGLSYSVGDTITFKLQVKNYLNSYPLYFNRTEDDSDTTRKFRGVSTITVQEV